MIISISLNGITSVYYSRQGFVFHVYRSVGFGIHQDVSKSVLRIDMKDEIEYDDSSLNGASKFESKDELFNIDFTMAGNGLERMGDSDFFSLSMKNVNNDVEYGKLRAFFKTQVT